MEIDWNDVDPSDAVSILKVSQVKWGQIWPEGYNDVWTNGVLDKASKVNLDGQKE